MHYFFQCKEKKTKENRKRREIETKQQEEENA